MTHADQIRALARTHELPQVLYRQDLEWDVVELSRHQGEPFVFALAAWGTQLFWFHLKPNPWGTLERFLGSVGEALPGVRYWLVGLEREPIELGFSPNAQTILDLMEGV